jgi:hypothetical protein
MSAIAGARRLASSKTAVWVQVETEEGIVIDDETLTRLDGALHKLDALSAGKGEPLADTASRLLDECGLEWADLICLLQDIMAARRAAQLTLGWTRMCDYMHLQRYEAVHDGEHLVVVQMPIPSVDGMQPWVASVAGFPLRCDRDRLRLFRSPEEAMAAAEEDVLRTYASVLEPAS